MPPKNKGARTFLPSALDGKRRFWMSEGRAVNNRFRATHSKSGVSGRCIDFRVPGAMVVNTNNSFFPIGPIYEELPRSSSNRRITAGGSPLVPAPLNIAEGALHCLRGVRPLHAGWAMQFAGSVAACRKIGNHLAATSPPRKAASNHLAPVMRQRAASTAGTEV